MGEVMLPVKKISRKVGFSDTETNVILFIIFAFIVGLGVNLFKDSSSQRDSLEFDYKVQDGLFDAAAGNPQITDTTVVRQKNIASKPELLDFSKAKKSQEKIIGKTRSTGLININKASVEELTSLPGIGSKTAQNIIDYRNRFGNFKSPDKLLKVKGIGSKKFDKLKNRITVK